MKAIVVLVAVALCACGKSKSGDVNKSDECKAVTDHLTALQLENAKNIPEAQRDKFVTMMHKVGDAVTVNCREMKWPPEVTTCLKNMKSLAEGDACQAKLTPEQKSSVDKAVEDAQEKAVKEMQPMRGSDAPAPQGSGSASSVDLDTSKPAGSGAAGSGAAGSATGSAAK